MLAGDRKNTVLSSMNTTGRVDSAYTAYGYRKDQPLNGSAIGFNGQFLEESIAGYALGNGTRIYSPLLMKFHSPDNYGVYGEAGFNQYAYCFGNPNDFTDPSGNVPSGLGWLVKVGRWMSKAFRSSNVTKSGQQTNIITADDVAKGWEPIWNSKELNNAGVNKGVVKSVRFEGDNVKSVVAKSVSSQSKRVPNRGKFRYIADGPLETKVRGTGVKGPKFTESLENPSSGIERLKSRLGKPLLKRNVTNPHRANLSRREEEMQSVERAAYHVRS